MLIPCPVCGSRDHGEFTYGGDATVVRPTLEDSDPRRWAAYVYDRRNPRGLHTEYWHHVHGCRSWMIVERNTETHEVGAARLIGPFAGPPSPESETG
ncbi:MAG TPA: sarcosine oxidase subunit delta [Arenibaculum sp.]|jgi:sarcosine oxidase subunit delta|nr:sarcosine oxidase subunit delta [Arenibaculum sp.]